MKFFIIGEHETQSLENTLHKLHIIISYKTPDTNYTQIEYSPDCKGVLELWIHDFDELPTEEEERLFRVVYFVPSDAKKILDFVDTHKNSVEVIVCQCDAGISRSSGTAAALSLILNGDDDWVMKDKRYFPNQLIYQTILREAIKRDEIQNN